MSKQPQKKNPKPKATTNPNQSGKAPKDSKAKDVKDTKAAKDNKAKDNKPSKSAKDNKTKDTKTAPKASKDNKAKPTTAPKAAKNTKTAPAAKNKDAKNAGKKAPAASQKGPKSQPPKKKLNEQIKKIEQKGRQKVTNTKSSRKPKTTKAAPSQNKQTLELIIKSKFLSPEKKAPTEIEQQICQHLIDLEASSKDLKGHLRDLGIVSARQFQITPTKHAIVIFVPYAQHEKWQVIQEKLVRELEKKFSGQDVLFLAQRKIMKLNEIKNNYPRPRNQTITAVHEQILNDLVYPVNIVGKRLRFRVGGKRLLKVYLDPKESKNLEAKLPTFEAVYQKMTKKEVKFLFPRYVI